MTGQEISIDVLEEHFNEDGSLKNPKYELYAQSYVQSFQHRQAAIDCGFDPSKTSIKDAAYRISKKPEVRRRIRAVLADRVDDIAINEDWVILRLANLVDRALQATEVLDREGNPIGEWQFDGRNANRSLELLGNHLGMFKQKDVGTAEKVIINVDYGNPEQLRITREVIEHEVET